MVVSRVSSLARFEVVLFAGQLFLGIALRSCRICTLFSICLSPSMMLLYPYSKKQTARVYLAAYEVAVRGRWVARSAWVSTLVGTPFCSFCSVSSRSSLFWSGPFYFCRFVLLLSVPLLFTSHFLLGFVLLLIPFFFSSRHFFLISSSPPRFFLPFLQRAFPFWFRWVCLSCTDNWAAVSEPLVDKYLGLRVPPPKTFGKNVHPYRRIPHTSQFIR